MNISVHKAANDEAETLFTLIDALADFEELAPPDADAKARLKRDGWPEDGSAPRFTAWLATAEDTEAGTSQAVGYAITFLTYSSFLARPTLYIEDIFVLTTHRRQSVGSALMQALIREAISLDCGRMEWVVLDWNVGAQAFYQRLGAAHLDNWCYYRLRREDMPAALTGG